MKSKYLFLALAASATFVGCSDEEFLANGAGESAASKKVISADDIRFEVSKDGASTRAVWDNSDGTYVYNWNASDAIGVAYIGDAGNEMSSQGVTNYRFQVDSLYDSSLALASSPVTPTKRYTTKFAPISSIAAATTDLYEKDWLASYGEANYNALTKSTRAKFKTVNDYIFEGYYAIYYPFNEDYLKKGYIPVTAPEELIVYKDLSDNLQAAASNAFAYSKSTAVAAGRQVSEFKLNPLTGILRLNLRNNTNAVISTVQKILVVPSKEFIVSGKLNNVDANPSKSVISDPSTAMAFVVKFSNNAWNGSFSAAAVSLPIYNASNAAATTKSVYFPMLPMDGFTGMDVYLVDADEAAIKVVKSANFNIPAGQAQPVGIDIPAGARFDHYIAYDQASLINAANNAPNNATIEVMKPITVSNASSTVTVAVANKVTISGEAITLGKNATMNFGASGATVNSEIKMAGGTLIPTNATFNKLTVVGDKTAKITTAGTFNFAEIVNNGTLEIGDGTNATSVDAAKVTNNGTLKIMNASSVNATSYALDNKGEVYQYVGSVIGAKGIANANGASYVCEVVNQVKFNEAISRNATKIVLAASVQIMVPATGMENIVLQFDKQALLTCANNLDANGRVVEVTGVVKGIISNDASGSYPRIDQNLTVGTNGIVVNEGKKLVVKKNRTVNVNGKIVLKKNATFEREQGGADGIEAKVNCTGIETGSGAQWVGGQPNY